MVDETLLCGTIYSGLCCFGGVDVGCIEEWTGDLGTSFISNSRGARVLSVWYSKSYGALQVFTVL